MKALLISVIVLSCQLIGAEPRLWTAGTVGNDAFSNYAIEKWGEDYLLSDTDASGMFKKAEENWDKYQELKTKWLSERFERILKKYMNIRILQYEALFEQASRNKDDLTWLKKVELVLIKAFGFDKLWQSGDNHRPFFMASTDFVEKIINDYVESVLTENLKKGMTREQAQIEYAKSLKKTYFPHRADESDLDIFTRWKDLTYFRIVEEYRESESRQFAIYKGTIGKSQLFVNPDFLFAFHKTQAEAVRKNIDGIPYDKAKLKEYFLKNPDQVAVIKELSSLSLEGNPVSKIQEKSPAQFQKSLDLIVNKFLPLLNQQKINKVLGYEEIAQEFSEKYATKKELRKLGKSSWDDWISTGNYTSFMMARLYALAIILKERPTDRQACREYTSKFLSDSFDFIRVNFANPKFYTSTDDYKKLTFESLIAKVLGDRADAAIKKLRWKHHDKEYLRQTLNMAMWAVKFDGMKVAMEDKGKVYLEVLEMNSPENYTYVEYYLKRKMVTDGVLQYQQEYLRKELSTVVSVNPKGKERLVGDKAFDFVFGPATKGLVEGGDSEELELPILPKQL